ncbi:unnamed protein product [Arctogadus glacialis]
MWSMSRESTEEDPSPTRGPYTGPPPHRVPEVDFEAWDRWRPSLTDRGADSRQQAINTLEVSPASSGSTAGGRALFSFTGLEFHRESTRGGGQRRPPLLWKRLNVGGGGDPTTGLHKGQPSTLAH